MFPSMLVTLTCSFIPHFAISSAATASISICFPPSSDDASMSSSSSLRSSEKEMSQAKGATSMRRMVGLFNTSISSATNATATSAAAVKSSKSKVDPRKFKKLADRFKKSLNPANSAATPKKLTPSLFNASRRLRYPPHDAYGKAGMSEHAHKLFDEMPEINCQRTVNSLNALLSAYLHSEKFDNVGNFLEELPEKIRIEPDLISYNTIIKAYCEMGSMDSAVSMIDTLEKKGLEPDIRTFNTLLMGYCNAGNLEQVMKWYGELKKSVLPDRVTYITVLSFFSKKNEFEMATEICKEAIDRRIIYGAALVDKLVKESRIEEAIQFVESGLSRSALRLKFPRP
ncbi:hypothetical protein F3Y22_tig00004111pilonHSYRG00035 [Hibiscus syriacus]|uniref:Pentatricopeptide repeat-containing protein n=1 Tax=Hibiscus syriacus TaxID=106335 RepID=A0A6A3CMP9_HIBSY|nr:hypothetical protein F3Y22_tig00004111pilonHSYRG00035 [Hibiscus syriacus]